MKDLQKLLKECKEELDVLGIQYSTDITSLEVNKRAKNRWGQCKKNGGIYSINISERLLKDDIKDEVCKETIIHELLHTCKGCFNHGKEWKRLGELVTDCYCYYNITRCSSASSMGIEIVHDEYKYAFKCKNCGEIIYRRRESKFTKNHQDYCCSGCGGKFEKVEI